MSDTRTPLPHPLCASFCSKKLYMIADGQEVTFDDLQTAGYEHSWCMHTMTDTGPDGGWVIYERCTPARTCFEAKTAAREA